MAQQYDIYNLQGKLDRYIVRIKADSAITEQNKKSILSFFDYCFANSLSVARVLIYACRLFPIAKMLGKDFKEATKDDIQALVGQIERNPNFKPGTKHFYKVTLKKFYKWLEGNDEEYPDKVKWLKGSGKSRRMLPEELLTLEDVQKLIQAAPNQRDKAFVSMLFESGCRIGELATLKVKHVSYDSYGAQIAVTGKTGARRVRLLSSVPYLTNWLDYHPWKNNPEAPLWPRMTNHWKGQPLRYSLIRIRITKIAKKAGVTKKVNPHSFRHARATQLARMGLSEIQMSSLLGWVPSTRMASTYVHLAGRDVDNALLKAHGIEVKENNEDKLTCPRCTKQNFLNTKFCTECGMPLNIRASVELEDKRSQVEEKMSMIMDLLEKDEFRKLFVSYLAKKSTSE